MVQLQWSAIPLAFIAVAGHVVADTRNDEPT